MKLIYFLIFFFPLTVLGQYEYDTSDKFPFGKANPKAPEQIKDYEAMIGECDCKSSTRNQDGTWT